MEIAYGGTSAGDRASDARQRRWPEWPVANPSCRDLLLEVLDSGRWTVRGACTGTESKEEAFARRFADWNGVRHCVPAASGSAAVLLALEALDVGPGDEVIVPVLGWVATAAAVLAVGAVPVPVDVDGETGCLAAETVAPAITSRTRVAVVVHLHSTVVDLQPLLSLCDARGVAVVEDCAQAIGAHYHGRPVGAWGRLGCFSMNQEKVLAAGEGGAVITDDPVLAERLHGLRADGHRYLSRRTEPGDAFDGFCGVMGSNLAMSEFAAAVALGQLAGLDAQIARRDHNLRYLDREFDRRAWLTPLRAPAGATRRSVYEYGVRVDRKRLRRDRDLEAFGEALTAAVGFPVYPTDAPLHQNPIFAPETKRRFANNLPRWAADGYPAAEQLWNELLVFPHAPLLAEPEAMAAIVRAFDEVSGQFLA